MINISAKERFHGISESKISSKFIRFKNIILPLLQYKISCAGLMIILGITVIAIGAPIIALTHYAEVNLNEALQPPSLKHPFGTDMYGRDIFSRVVYGARIALWVGFIVVLIEAGIGITLGLIAGYYGGTVDKIISAVSDIIWSFPLIPIALGIVAILGPGLTQVVAAIALVSWPPFTRVTRAKVQSLVNREFILAAKAIGETDFSIMFRYLLPNTLSSIIVLMTLTIPSAILSTTALSFLGFGAQPPTPDWGAMVSDGITQLVVAPWVATFPGIFVVITSLGFNLLGDGLRDLLDPKLKV